MAVPSACRPAAPPGVPGPDGLDETVRPQDDLYRHVNGRWLRDYRLPPDQSVSSPITEVMRRVEQQLSTVIQEIREPGLGTPEQQVRDFAAAALAANSHAPSEFRATWHATAPTFAHGETSRVCGTSQRQNWRGCVAASSAGSPSWYL
ncbi:hypothetical protein [Nocardia sp. NPDC047038]|uniref:hypothetical protein n=1 Tax=Nocardia sp. NPDC047038 TaxID=3154338 RepID=UPI0033EE2AC4